MIEKGCFLKNGLDKFYSNNGSELIFIQQISKVR